MQFSRDQVKDAFWQVEEATQEILPGSSFHPRYQKSGSVGLSLMYLPFNHTDIIKVNNLADHPQAWEHDGVGYKSLVGFDRAKGTARFDVFARAKLATLEGDSTRETSFALEVPRGRGRVGFAGGVRHDNNDESAVSGLFELHDHYVNLAHYMLLTGKLTLKRVSDHLESRFVSLAARHIDIPADTLTREELHTLLIGGSVQS